MATVQIDNSTKEKLQQLARRRHRSEGEVVAELVHQVVPQEPRSIRDALAGQITDPLTPEDFDGLHQDMVKRYGPYEA